MTPYRVRTYLAYARKALINVIGIAGVLLAEGLVPKPYDHWVSIGIAVVAAAIHYTVPNGAKPGTASATNAPDEDDDAYEPTGASDDDLVSVDATPAVVSARPADIDPQQLIAAVVDLLARSARLPDRPDAHRPPDDEDGVLVA